MKVFKWVALFLGIVTLIVIFTESMKFMSNKKHLNGIELVGRIVSSENFGESRRVSELRIIESSTSIFLPDDRRFAIEICDSTARIIYSPGDMVFGEFYENKDFFLVGSIIKFNIEGDGWIREFRNGIEVNKVKALKYTRPYNLKPFCD